MKIMAYSVNVHRKPNQATLVYAVSPWFDGCMAVVTHDEVIKAALKLVDHEGLEAISMRRVGDALGLSSLALYHYFPSNDSILHGVFQAILAELPPLAKRGSWQTLASKRAHEFRKALMKHPNAISLFATRPA